jgi:hypothetical protein
VFFLIVAVGTIDPRKIMLNGDHALFVLQECGNEYPVKTLGMEQYKMVQNYRAGENVFILGTAQSRKKILITPSLLLMDDPNNNNPAIMKIILQTLETHLCVNWAK